MTHFLEHKDALVLIHKNNLTRFLREQAKDHFRSLKTMDRLTFEMEHKLLLHADAFYGALRLWFDYGMQQSPIEILEKTKIADPEGNLINTAGCRVWSSLSGEC